MNKIKVGNAPPPKLREVKSKIGSLQNASHKAGGGNVKIETKKLEYNVQSRIAAKNENYQPGGGDKKVRTYKQTRFSLIYFDPSLMSYLNFFYSRLLVLNCNGMLNLKLVLLKIKIISRVVVTKR